MPEVVAVQEKAGIDTRVLDERELIALVRATLEEIEAHGEWNELKILLGDCAKELLERRLLEKIQLVHLMELPRPE